MRMMNLQNYVTDLSKYKEIIIWGAAFPPQDIDGFATSHGHAMEKLMGVLRREGQIKKVVAIVDSNQNLWGKERFGIKVTSPSVISDYNDALVIINSLSIQDIKNMLNKQCLREGEKCSVVPYYFYHGTLDHPYDNNVAKKYVVDHLDELYSLYECSDSKTKKYLDIIVAMRLKAKDDVYNLNLYNGTGEKVDYFCDEDLAPNGNVTFFDIGAFIGDSINPVVNFYGDRLKRYVGFEPDMSSFEKLQCYIEGEDLSEKSYLLPYALGDSDGEIRFSVAGMTGQVSEQGEIVLQQRRFDDLSDMDIVGSALVKMDIEGAELGALKGMEKFIQRNEPYLAICIYHKEEDIFEIAKYIKGLNKDYRLYIRGGWHLECWAVPQKHFKGACQ